MHAITIKLVASGQAHHMHSVHLPTAANAEKGNEEAYKASLWSYLLRVSFGISRLGSRNRACCTQSLARGTGACCTYSKTRRSTSLVMGSLRPPDVLGSSPADMQASIRGSPTQQDHVEHTSGYGIAKASRCARLVPCRRAIQHLLHRHGHTAGQETDNDWFIEECAGEVHVL